MSLKNRITSLEQSSRYKKLADPLEYYYLPDESEDPIEHARVRAIEAVRTSQGKKTLIITTSEPRRENHHE